MSQPVKKKPGANSQSEKSLEQDNSPKLSIVQDSNPVRERARIYRRLEKEMDLNSYQKIKSNSGLSRLLFLSSIISLCFFALDHYGVLDRFFPPEEIPAQKQNTLKAVRSSRESNEPQDVLPAYVFGDEFTYRHFAINGASKVLANEDIRYQVIGMVGDNVSWRLADQSLRVTMKNPFIGNLEDYNTFDPSTGAPKIIGDIRSLFPMRVGNEMNLKQFGEKYHCKVTGKENIKVPAGTFETYLVHCATSGSSRSREEIFYYSTEVRHWVQRKTFLREGDQLRKDEYQLVSFKRVK